MNQTDRFVRQAALVPRDRLLSLSATVIGVGAVGRQAAIQLAALGAPRIRLVDFDRVEPTNVTTQGYLAEDVGESKVEATARMIRRIDPALEVVTVFDRHRPGVPAGDAAFCCVDSISSRAAVWRSLWKSGDLKFWCDARVLGETVRVLAADDGATREAYGRTLFPQADAQTGTCSSRGAVYASVVAAGLMVHQFARWLRGLPVEPDSLLNLLAGEWAVPDRPTSTLTED